jgi:hypothetical protein
LLAACVATGTRAQRIVGMLLGSSALFLPALIPAEHPIVRGGAALTAFAGFMRVMDLHRGEWSVRERLAHASSLVDTRRLVWRGPRLDARALLEGLAWVGVVVIAYDALRASISLEVPAVWFARWGSSLVMVYAGVCAGYRFVAAIYAAIGFRTPALHEAPILSRSVQELWGERWARPVSTWLAETFFKPLARKRRPLAGALAAFLASAAFHAYAIWIALGFANGLAMASWMFGYFVVQAVVMALERSLGVRRWGARAGHVWTVSWMVATAPLFLEPAVRVLGFPAL